MPVTMTNLIMGPATIYSGAFGATEPADSAVASGAPASAAWTDMGGTLGGVKLAVNQTYTVLQVDQVVDVAGRRLTARDIQVVTALAEPTLQNFAVALNGGTVATAGAPVLVTYDPAGASSATQPAYTAILFDGWGPNGKVRRCIVRKVLSMANTELNYTKDAQAQFAVSFGAHYVSSVIPLFHIVDSSV